MRFVRTSLLAAALALGAGCKDSKPASGGGTAAPPPSPAPTASADAAPAPPSPDAAAAVPAYAPPADAPAAIRDAVTAADRTDADRALDAGRKPAEVLTFFRVAPGQRVAELFAGAGYTSELLARVVGPSGAVFAHNTKDIMDRFARGPWTERAARPAMKGVVAVERPLDAPLPPEARDLDAVIMILTYHDAVWTKVDRAKMNQAVLAALKPGGVYGLVDHSAAPGSGERDAETLHRIDQELVTREVTAAGFRLDGESDVLRHPEDARDWNSSPRAAGERRGTSDRFVLRFVKP